MVLVVHNMFTEIRTKSLSWKSQEEPCGIHERFRNLSAWLRDHVIVTSLIIFLCSAGPRLVPYLVARFR